MIPSSPQLTRPRSLSFAPDGRAFLRCGLRPAEDFELLTRPTLAVNVTDPKRFPAPRVAGTRDWIGLLLSLVLFGPAAMFSAPMDSSFTAADAALHVAIQRRDFAALEAALAAGASPRSVSPSGETPLHTVAVQWGETRALAVLVARGAEMDARTPDGETPLMAAVGRGHASRGQPEALATLVAWFVARGANLTLADRAGRTPMAYALERGDLPLLRQLLTLGATLPRDALRRALVIGAASCDLELVRFILAQPLEHDLGMRDGFGATLMHQAVAAERTQFVAEWLRARGADLRATDGAGRTVFAAAAGALGGNIAALEWLKREGALTFAPDTDGATPLHQAAGDPRPAVLRWLVDEGADLQVRDQRGRRPLDVAIDTHRFAFRTAEQKRELVALLGGSDADILRGRFSDHPLHAAVQARDLGTIKKLLKQGVSPDTRNAAGDTPLRAAIDRVSRLPFTPEEQVFGRKLLPVLVAAGADSTLRMGDGFSISYEQHARDLGVGPELAEAMRRHSPARASK